MIEVDLSFEINCPIEDVFAYTTDRANLSQWFVGVLEAQQHGPNQVGTKTTVTVAMMGMKTETVNEVVAYEPNREFVIESDKPFPMTESQTFTANGSSTRIDYHVTFHTQGFYRLIEPVMRRMMKRQTITSFTRLKEILESQNTASSV